MQPYTIGVVGLWHLGEVYAAGMARLGHSVIGFDTDRMVIEKLSRGIPPIAEPRVEETISENMRAGRLAFTSNPEDLAKCDIIWMAHDTPIDEENRPDTSVIFESFKIIAPVAPDGVLIVISSQMPVGTTRKLKSFLQNLRPGMKFDLLYAPENLRLGTAIENFLNPPRIVIGAENDAAHEILLDVFQGINTAFLKMSWESAEMAKHALNAFLAASLSFINDLADLCEAVGADILDVAKALKLDPRIGPGAYVNAGLGFSGGTLGRDVKALLEKGKECRVPLEVLRAVEEKNSKRRLMVAERLENLLGGLEGKVIAIFGLTYKAGTPTLRRSMALEIMRDLEQAGAKTKSCDPMASSEELKKTAVDFYEDPYKAAEGCHAILLLTEWPEFLSLDFSKLRSRMQEPAVFFDAKNMLHEKEEALKKLGFRYAGIGRGRSGQI